MNFNDWIGTIGVGIVLLAYFLNNFSLIKRNGNLYYVLNVIGGGVSCYAAVLINFMPFVILEGIWTILSGVSLFQNIKKPQA